MTVMCPVDARPWTIREATIDDVPAINELFYALFGLHRDDAGMRWKFFQNPSGPALLMVAEDHGRLVGNYALWPVPIRLGPEVVRGAQSIDTMTHADYRRQGILLQLAGAGMEIAASKGVEVLYGFPNEASYPASVRRWSHVSDRAEPEWYDWRFSPLMGNEHAWLTLELDGRTVAFAVWGRDTGGKNAYISDIVGESDAAIAALIAYVFDHARAAGCSAVSTITNRRDLLPALRGNGFRLTGEMPFKVRRLTSRALPSDIDEFQNWRLLGADCDVY